MEQFLLGIFQEQLAKIIVGFRKEQVNASLLNGKGEIVDVSLNCAFLNEKISKITPFIEFERIHLSKLGFHVTSWTNLRKAPILIDIEHITATIREPLQYVDKSKRRTLRMFTEGELLQLVLAGLWKPTRNTGGSYGLVDRIIDNLTIEIKRLTLNHQTCGRFKTRRHGPWTPPLLQIQLRHLKVVSVDEYGQEGSPDDVWKHNRHHHVNYMLYKKVSMSCSVNILTRNGSHNANSTTTSSSSTNGEENTTHATPTIIHLVNETKLEVQIAFKRRLQDGAFLAVQLDATIPRVEVQVEAHVVPLMAHLASGLKYCFAKDRSFEDPLRPESDDPDYDNNNNTEDNIQKPKPASTSQEKEYDNEEEENNNFEQDTDDDDNDDAAALNDNDDDDAKSSSSSTTDEEDIANETETQDAAATSTSSTPSTSSAKIGSFMFPNNQATFNNRPVIMLPSGGVIHESVSITFSIHHVTVRGTYPSELDGYVQLVTKGCIAELIWPKTDNQKGCYGQMSISYLSLQERHGTRIRTIVIGGMAQFAHDHSRGPLEKPDMPPREINADENFPLFEGRSIRGDPLDIRHSFPSQAVGLKTTIDFLDSVPKKMSQVPSGDSSTTSNSSNEISGALKDMSCFVLHEVGIDKFDIVLDSDAWCRAVKFALNESGGGFDPRWNTGDWSDCLTVDMLRRAYDRLELENHIQNAKQILLDENSMISSDLFNVTARLANIEVRVPAAIHENARSTDVVLRLDETMLVVSSALPRTFISGKLGNSINGDDSDKKGIIDFPNDPSDIAYALERLEDPSLRQQGVVTSKNVSTFRLQLTMRGLSIRTIPVIPFCVAREPQQLLAPTDLTMILCFEGEAPEAGKNDVEISLFVSIQIHKFRINVDLDLLAGAACTLSYHADAVKSTVALAQKLLLTKPSTTSLAMPEKASVVKQTQSAKATGSNQAGLRKNLRGRRVMVRRQFKRSRETGGLSVVFCLQQAELSVTLWRQNVPLTSPLRCSSLDSPNADERREGVATRMDQDDACLSVLRLAEFLMKDFEVGIEFAFRSEQTRRTIFKCCIGGMSLKVCDLTAAISKLESQPENPAEDGGIDSKVQDKETDPDTKTQYERATMIDVLLIGAEAAADIEAVSKPSGQVQQFALRLEEQLQDTRSWSMAVDMTSGASINLHIDEINDVVVLVIEALLLPSWSKQAMVVKDGAPFPSKTIGCYLFSLLPEKTVVAESTEFRWDKKDKAKPSDSGDAVVERLLHYAFDLFLPSDLRLVLLRLEIGNLLMTVPSKRPVDQVEDRAVGGGLLLQNTNAVIRFCPVYGTDKSNLVEVLACKGLSWSSLIATETSGFYYNISSCQSLLSVPPKRTEAPTVLVSPFDVSFSYVDSKVALSMDNKLLVQDLRRIERFSWQLFDFIERCKTTKSKLEGLLLAIRQTVPASTTEDVSSHFGKGLLGSSGESWEDCARSTTAVTLVRSGRELLGRLNKELSIYELLHRRMLQKNAEDLDQLKSVVFMKEKERFGALSLLSSRVAGWIRMGGRHKTGERVLKTTTMVPYWAVLRKSLLLLYRNPGEPKPSDAVLLDGSSLRQLAGGKSKQDTKRGFAIIEYCGTTRFFMTQSAPEWALWIREIQRTIDTNAKNSSAKIEGNALDRNISPLDESQDVNDIDSYLEDEGNPKRIIRLGNRFAGVGQATKSRIGTALQSARQKGIEVAGRKRLNTADSSEFSMEGDPDAVNNCETLASPQFPQDQAVKRESASSQTSSSDPVKISESKNADKDRALAEVEGASARDSAPHLSKAGIDGMEVGVDKAMVCDDDLDLDSEDGTLSKEDAGTGPKRRIQFGRAFSEVGQATKSKLESAIQNARQKGTELTPRRRRNANDSSDLVQQPNNESMQATVESNKKLLDDDSDAVNEDPNTLETRHSNAGFEHSEASSSSTIHRSMNPDDAGLSTSGANLRMRFGNNFTKIGSAIQNARQKGKEVIERQQVGSDHGTVTPTRGLPGIRGRFAKPTSSRSEEDPVEGDRQSDDGALFISLDPDTTPRQSEIEWSCSACTFINADKNSGTCEMCGSARPMNSASRSSDATNQDDPTGDGAMETSQVEKSSFEAKQNILSENSNTAMQSNVALQNNEQEEILEGADPSNDNAEPAGIRLAMRGRLGNFGPTRGTRTTKATGQLLANQAVSGVRVNRFMFRRRGMDEEGASNEKDVLTLKNIRAGNLPPSSDDDIVQHYDVALPTSDNEPIAPQLLKKFEGDWTVIVKSCRSLETEDAHRNTQTSAESSEQKPVGVEDERFTKDATLKGGCNPPTSASQLKPQNGKGRDLQNGAKGRNIFRVQVFRGHYKEKQLAVERYCGLSDILSLHAQISESVATLLPQSSHPNFKGSRNNSIDMDSRLALHLGLSSFDNIKVSGRLLGGLLELSETSEMIEKTHDYQADVIEAFLSATLESALPIEALAALTEVLGISASTQDIVHGVGAINMNKSERKHEHRNEEELDTNTKGSQCATDISSADLSASNLGEASTNILRLLAACDNVFLRAQNYEAMNLTSTGSCSPSTAAPSKSLLARLHEPLLPPSVTEHFHDAMHQALMKVMAERDEAHAQLIAASVLHVHELEQERKKNELLLKQLEAAEAVARAKPNMPQFFGTSADKPKQEAEETLQQYHRQMVQNNDAELVALCQQLAGEISAKTSATLEIIRLRESRDIERKQDAAEKQALKDELKRVKDLLAVESQRADDALQERNSLRHSFETIVASQRKDDSNSVG